MTRGELIDALCAADRQPSAENVRLLHELQIHQVELEMQNKQLRDTQEQLEESRGRYADLFDLAPVAYCVLDRNGTIEDANLAASTLLRMSRSSLVGLPFSRVVTIAEKQTFANHIARCFEEELRVTSELTVTVRGRGEVILQAVSTPLLDGPTGRAKACRTMLNDITRLKRSETTFGFLASITEALSSSLDVKATLNAVVKACVPMLADACFVDLCDGEDDAPLRRVETQLATTNPAELDLLRRHAYDPAWRKYEAQLVATLTPVFEPASAAALGATLESQLGARALLLLPLVGRTRRLGVLGALMSHSGRVYSLQDFELAQDVARRAAMALDNALAYEQIQELVDGRPRSSNLQVPLTPPQTIVPAAESRPRPVLIVLDRDEESRSAMRDALQSRGFAVIDTDDALHTAKYLRATATPPVAVIADERVIEGQDVALFRTSRVIVIGPKARTSELARTFGAIACFEKPVSIDDLLATIDD
jgi:PAS domain S-box-containing protein